MFASTAGKLTAEGQLLIVISVSLCASLVALLVTRAPDPATLVAFYRKVRPLGAWGPVRALAPFTRPAFARMFRDGTTGLKDYLARPR